MNCVTSSAGRKMVLRVGSSLAIWERSEGEIWERM